MKRFLAIVMAVMLACTAFAGCNSNDSSDGSGDGLKIGCLGPLTGNTAVYGIAVKNGAELAVKEINAAGGVNGYNLVLNAQDDEGDTEKAVNAYNNLKDWGMKVLVGTTTSGPCQAVLPSASSDNMFLLTPSATAVEAIDAPNAFRVCFSDPSQGTVSAQYIFDNKLGTKVGVIYNVSDVYSSGIYATFKAKAGELGLDIVAAESFTDDSKTDFSVQLQKMQEAGADLVFLPIYYQEASLILQQAKSKGYAPSFFGVDGLDGILTMKNFDASLAEDVMLLTPFSATSTDEKTVAFVNAYKDAYGEIPIQFAADAYDAVYIIKAALEKANVTDPQISSSELCDILMKSITEIEFSGVTGDITWGADGEPNKSPLVKVIKNGAYEDM